MDEVLKYLAVFFSLIRGYDGPAPDPNSVYCMAHAVYHEARGEPFAGQIAVAQVVKNRVHHEDHPDDTCEVVYEPWQFSHIKDTKPDHNSDAWRQAVIVSVHVHAGTVADITLSSDHFKNVKTATAKWDYTKFDRVGSVGNHTFFRHK